MPSSINEYVENIKTAVYGSEVRDSIAYAIEEMNSVVDDISEAFLDPEFVSKGVLANNADLNNVVAAGTYSLSTSNTYYNLPDKASKGLTTLIVFPKRSTTDSGCVQMLVQNTTTYPYVFTRIKVSSGWSSWADNIEDLFVYCGVLPSDTDLNDITDPGTYYLNSSYTYVNKPDKAANGLAMLIVFPKREDTGTACVQMIVQNTNTYAYVFTRINANSGWCLWSDNIESDINYFGGLETELKWNQGTFNESTWRESASDDYIRTASDIDTRAIDRVEFNISDDYRVYFMLHYPDGRSSERVIRKYAYPSFCDVSETDKIRIVIRYEAGATDISTSVGDLFHCKLITSVYKKAKDFVPRNLMASFKRFAVMSDSLGAGRVYPDDSSEDSQGVDDKSISWPTFLSRSLNNTVYNHSLHGQSADTFILGELRNASTGDNSLECALDGNHDVPLIIIQFGANNTREIAVGSESDINVDNCENNGDTIIGNMAKLIQRISNYYSQAHKSVHIAVLLYASIATGQDETKVGGPRNQRKNWLTAINKIKQKVLSQGNYLWAIDIYADDPWDMVETMLESNATRNHWTSIGYNALGELIGLKVSEYMWNHQEDFQRIEFSGSNTYITSYSNPSNYT